MTKPNVVDSSAWLEYFADTPLARRFASAIEDAPNLIVPVVTLYEVFKKVRRARGDDEALQVVAAMLHGSVVDVDVSLALEAAQLDLPLADSLVYATALRHGATVWTQDADFEGLPGVKLLPQALSALVVGSRPSPNTLTGSPEAREHRAETLTGWPTCGRPPSLQEPALEVAASVRADFILPLVGRVLPGLTALEPTDVALEIGTPCGTTSG